MAIEKDGFETVHATGTDISLTSGTQTPYTGADAVEFFVVTSKSGMHIGLWDNEEIANLIVAQESDHMLSKVISAKEHDRVLADNARLRAELEKTKAVKSAARQAFVHAAEARPAGYERAILEIERILEAALKEDTQ